LKFKAVKLTDFKDFLFFKVILRSSPLAKLLTTSD
jgi:hypothetical protein